MNKAFIEGAGIKQLATINFTHSRSNSRRDSLIKYFSLPAVVRFISLHKRVCLKRETSCKDR